MSSFRYKRILPISLHCLPDLCVGDLLRPSKLARGETDPRRRETVYFTTCFETAFMYAAHLPRRKGLHEGRCYVVEPVGQVEPDPVGVRHLMLWDADPEIPIPRSEVVAYLDLFRAPSARIVSVAAAQSRGRESHREHLRP